MSAATEAANRAENATAPCANCGHPRNSRFCPKCGQNDRDYIRSLPPLLGDILKETFELDSRIRRTVRPLFLRPGELASEFSRNRRASYMSPVRLYLVTSIAFFFLLSVFGLSDFRPQQVEREEAVERVRMDLEDAREAADVDALKAVLPHPQRRKVDSILRRPGGSLAKMAVYGLAKDTAAYAERGSWQNYAVARVIDVAEDPADALSQFVQNLPFAMFVTLPAYALLLMLFFFGSHRYFTEHLVFAVQLHTFAFIVLAVSMLLPDGDDPERRPERPERPFATSEEGVPSPVIDVRSDGEGERAQRVVEALVDVSLEAEDTQAEGATDALELDGVAEAEDGVVIALGPTDDEDDGMNVFNLINLLLFLWLLAYHYLALRRFYRNGRLRTTIKWAALTFAYAILLIPGIALSALLTVFQLR